MATQQDIRFVQETIKRRYGAGFERFDDEMKADIIAGIVAQNAMGSSDEGVTRVMAEQVEAAKNVYGIVS